MVQESFLHLLLKEFCSSQLGPQQLIARLRHCAWTNSASSSKKKILFTSASFQLEYMNVRMLSILQSFRTYT